MLKSVQKLIDRAESGYIHGTIGNHSFESSDEYIYYFYHQTCVCIVSKADNVIKYNNGGWNTSSTTRTIRSYQEYYHDRTEVVNMP